MRALAVVVVLLFHLEVHGFGGGYLGVDLFFVISGFIITRNIQFDLKNSRFSLAQFYRRRIRRLLPALIAVASLTLLAGLVVIPPEELQQTARSVIYALFSVANINFWMQSGYFDAISDTKPMLHTWSLGVEEQFYLLWPAVLLLIPRPRILILVICALVVMSLGASWIVHDTSPESVFYLMPFRVHQLMVGALLSMVVLRPGGISAGLYTLLATVGFVALVMLISGEEASLLGGFAVSAIGAMLLMGKEQGVATFLYSNRLMLWIGKRSYALYLVHWPVIVLYKYWTDFVLDTAEKIGLAVACVVLTIGLHELVEKPFRMGREDVTAFQKAALPGTVLWLLATIFLAANIWGYAGLPSRLDPQIANILNARYSDMLAIIESNKANPCHVGQNSQFSEFKADDCIRIRSEAINVVILGDSLANDFSRMMQGRYEGVNFMQATAAACPPLRLQRGSQCINFNELVFSDIVHRDADLFILVANWGDYREVIPKLIDTMNYLKSLGKRVLVIGPRARFDRSVHLLIGRESSFENLNEKLGRYIKVETELLEDIRRAIPSESVFDMTSIQCTPDCEVIVNNRLLYRDHIHFTLLGAQHFGERFEAVFDLHGFIAPGHPGS